MKREAARRGNHVAFVLRRRRSTSSHRVKGRIFFRQCARAPAALESKGGCLESGVGDIREILLKAARCDQGIFSVGCMGLVREDEQGAVTRLRKAALPGSFRHLRDMAPSGGTRPFRHNARLNSARAGAAMRSGDPIPARARRTSFATTGGPMTAHANPGHWILPGSTRAIATRADSSIPGSESTSVPSRSKMTFFIQQLGLKQSPCRAFQAAGGRAYATMLEALLEFVVTQGDVGAPGAIHTSRR